MTLLMFALAKSVLRDVSCPRLIVGVTYGLVAASTTPHRQRSTKSSSCSIVSISALNTSNVPASKFVRSTVLLVIEARVLSNDGCGSCPVSAKTH